MTTMSYTGTLVIESCPACGTVHAIPEGLQREARRHSTRVFCPLGHRWHYTKSIEQELAEARNDATYYKDAMETARSRSAYKGELTKTRKAIHAGQCPWCHRRYKRLAAHARETSDVDVEAEPPSPS